MYSEFIYTNEEMKGLHFQRNIINEGTHVLSLEMRNIRPEGKYTIPFNLQFEIARILTTTSNR